MSEFHKKTKQLSSSKYSTKEVADDIIAIAPIKTEASGTIALMAITHGDEIIGLHLLIKLLDTLIDDSLAVSCNLYLILGNIPAYLKNQRYFQQDLNRQYGGSNIDSYEQKRALEIQKILDQSDALLDFHQTIEPTKSPFFLCSNDKFNLNWLDHLAHQLPVIVKDKDSKITTGVSYMNAQNKRAFTFEVSSYGVDQQSLGMAYDICIKALTSFDQDLHNGTRNQQYAIAFHQPYSTGKVIFAQQFSNLEFVEKGKLVATNDDEEIRAPQDGYILLYPAHWFDENSPTKADGIYFLLNKK